MHVIEARNVGQALPQAIRYLRDHGVRRDSRNGPVLVAPGPVTTVYQRPLERVLLYPLRDANPFFHLYEALWMLAGRRDVAGPAKILKSFAQFSDDGETFHGAYGHRWRHWQTVPGLTYTEYDLTHKGDWEEMDQLERVVHALKVNPDDRRCVLQMWDPSVDLGRNGKDVPCNQSAVFMINDGKLDMTVFCRSNDIIWGCYGANAVHFAFLLEYMALKIGIPVGTYTQVSVNWHAYDNALWQRVLPLADIGWVEDPYDSYAVPSFFEEEYTKVRHLPMPANIDDVLPHLLRLASLDAENIGEEFDWQALGMPIDPWVDMVANVFAVHAFFRDGDDPEDRQGDFDGIEDDIDWVVACNEWMDRRRAARGER